MDEIKQTFVKFESLLKGLNTGDNSQNASSSQSRLFAPDSDSEDYTLVKLSKNNEVIEAYTDPSGENGGDLDVLTNLQDGANDFLDAATDPSGENGGDLETITASRSENGGVVFEIPEGYAFETSDNENTILDTTTDPSGENGGDLDIVTRSPGENGGDLDIVTRSPGENGGIIDSYTDPSGENGGDLGIVTRSPGENGGDFENNTGENPETTAPTYIMGEDGVGNTVEKNFGKFSFGFYEARTDVDDFLKKIKQDMEDFKNK